MRKLSQKSHIFDIFNTYQAQTVKKHFAHVSTTLFLTFQNINLIELFKDRSIEAWVKVWFFFPIALVSISLLKSKFYPRLYVNQFCFYWNTFLESFDSPRRQKNRVWNNLEMGTVIYPFTVDLNLAGDRLNRKYRNTYIEIMHDRAVSSSNHEQSPVKP